MYVRVCKTEPLRTLSMSESIHIRTEVKEIKSLYPLPGTSVDQLNMMSKLVYVFYLRKTQCLKRMTYAQAVALHITCMT